MIPHGCRAGTALCQHPPPQAGQTGWAMARTTKHDVTPAWLGRALDGRARWGPGTCLLCVPDWGQKQSKDPTCPILCFVPAASLVPHRKGDFASVVLRALLTGICVSMLNSCLAGRSLGRTGEGLNTSTNAGAGVGRLAAAPTALTGPPNPLLSPPCSTFVSIPQIPLLCWGSSPSSGLQLGYFKGGF